MNKKVSAALVAVLLFLLGLMSGKHLEYNNMIDFLCKIDNTDGGFGGYSAPDNKMVICVDIRWSPKR